MKHWPPNYLHRRSRRAKQIRLLFSAHHGLEIVTPLRFNDKDLNTILNKHRDWIETHWREPLPKVLPDMLNLQAIHQQWQIHYRIGDKLPVTLSNCSTTHQLTLQGPSKDISHWQPLLHQWLRRIGKYYLEKQLDQLVDITGWQYNKLSIRQQKTRWGSCTKQKNISLNYHLLFLPPHLMRYVLIHELAHTQQLNHTDKFWQLVEQYDPLYQHHRKELHKTQIGFPIYA